MIEEQSSTTVVPPGTRRGARRARQHPDHESLSERRQAVAKTETRSSSTTADPITTEIIRNAFVSCAQDMNATLIRSSYTPIIYEGKDCSVAILDEHGDVLGQSLGLPLFLGNLEICVKLAAEMFGWDAFRPGDVFYMNDSYMTGTHLNDATIFGPIYWQRHGWSASRPRARTGSTSARKDAGGPMDSREIYQEGMRWGPTRIYDRGEPREDIIDLLAPERALRLLARRRHERTGGRVPHRRGALPGDPRSLRLRDVHRGSRRDLPPVGAARARGGGGAPGRDLPRRGLPGRRRARPRPDPGAASDRHRTATR